MYEIMNMTEAMQYDGFTGDWYSAIRNMNIYRVQVTETADGRRVLVHDQYMNGYHGEEEDNIINQVKEYRDEETN